MKITHTGAYRQHLTLQNIHGSSQIQTWLSQFASSDREIAESLLARLRFIPRDYYAEWLLQSIRRLPEGMFGIYAVRKVAKTAKSLWTKTGQTLSRPASSLGSEDFVASIVAIAMKENDTKFIDHPSLAVLRRNRIRNILLIDDTIGSGFRVSRFIELMTNHKRFRSWWSGGLIRIHVLSYARTIEGERYIRTHTIGSNHGLRKHPANTKVTFESHIVHDAVQFENRWGSCWSSVLSLCDRLLRIPKDRRRGFGDVMSNIVFYHSVPNNIPGMLISKRKNWSPIFPTRVLPNWCVELLSESQQNATNNNEATIPEVRAEFAKTLAHIGKGVRTVRGLARRIDRDVSVVAALVEGYIKAGLVSRELRLTRRGLDLVRENSKARSLEKTPDRSLYVPSTWCTDQE